MWVLRCMISFKRVRFNIKQWEYRILFVSQRPCTLSSNMSQDDNSDLISIYRSKTSRPSFCLTHVFCLNTLAAPVKSLDPGHGREDVACLPRLQFAHLLIDLTPCWSRLILSKTRFACRILLKTSRCGYKQSWEMLPVTKGMTNDFETICKLNVLRHKSCQTGLSLRCTFYLQKQHGNTRKKQDPTNIYKLVATIQHLLVYPPGLPLESTEGKGRSPLS